MSTFTESIVEDAALAWLLSLGYAVLHLPAPQSDLSAVPGTAQAGAARQAGGPDIAAGEPAAERNDPNYRDVALEGRLRQALMRFNPELPAEAIKDAYRKLTRTERRLFSGESRVKNARRAVEEAVS